MTELTVKEYARYERVCERTVWYWIQKGAVLIRHTPGGGVRVLVECKTPQSTASLTTSTPTSV